MSSEVAPLYFNRIIKLTIPMSVSEMSSQNDSRVEKIVDRSLESSVKLNQSSIGLNKSWDGKTVQFEGSKKRTDLDEKKSSDIVPENHPISEEINEQKEVSPQLVYNPLIREIPDDDEIHSSISETPLPTNSLEIFTPEGENKSSLLLRLRIPKTRKTSRIISHIKANALRIKTIEDRSSLQTDPSVTDLSQASSRGRKRKRPDECKTHDIKRYKHLKNEKNNRCIEIRK